NDNLSALVANLIEADLLIMLTDQGGLYSADPRSHPQAELIQEVGAGRIPPEIWEMAGGSRGSLGTGGMLTKLQASELARRSGSAVVIAPGSEKDVIVRLAQGERLGTRFAPTATAVESRKRYILTGGERTGALYIDAGAAAALAAGGSLLPVGVRSLEGAFERGDTVRVIAPDGQETARGLVNYNAADLARILGQHSDSIEETLGFFYGAEVIHRNHMVLL
ncbi:MAG TPA: glutamate 5-kinase, partial [Anaerolineales bacterium]|nr:glutamate 5-kinase [Anaerolineales bacterium]